MVSSAGAADGTGSAAQFNNPQGVAVDGAGNVYVADGFNSTIRKISSSGVVTTFAGTAGSPGSTDATGSVARFVSPVGVAIDGTNNIYVADGNGRIRKITPTAQVTTVATLSRSPRGIVVDQAGNIYISDDSTISKVTPGGMMTTLAGLVGSTGSNDGTGSTARLNYPQGIAVDGAGNVYVADSYNSAIRKITSDGVVTTLAGVAGARDVVDNKGSNARFVFPVGLAVDGVGNIYVTDNGPDRIRKITPAGIVTSLAGGNWGSLDGTGTAVQFSNASGIAVDGAGALWVADSVNNTIRKGVLAPPILTSASTGSGDLHQSFDYSATFSGDPTSYSASGLPSGLNCNFATGVIMGVPTAAGSFAVALGATNGAGTGTATFTLTIAKGIQTISFGVLVDKVFGAAPFTVNATADSGLSPTFSVVSGPATISGNTLTLTGAGTVAVRASQGGDSNYNAAADVDQSFIVAKAPATVTLGSLSPTYDGSAHAATATTNPTSLTVDFTYNGAAAAPSGAGTYAVVGTINDTNYQGAASGTFVIEKAVATVTLGRMSATYDGSAHAATATTNPASLTVNFTYNGSTTAPTNAGTYAVVGTIIDANYAGSAGGTLTIAKATPIITWATPSPIFFGTAISGTQLNASANTAGTYVYNPAAGEIRAAGLHTLTVSFTPTDVVNYNGASAQQSLIVNVPNGAPFFITQPTSQSVPVGSSRTLTSFATGVPVPTYQWRKDGVNISGATDSSYTIASVAMIDGGNYTVVATNSVAAQTSTTAVLTTYVAAPSDAVLSITVE